MGYANSAGKAASAYGKVNEAMGGGQQQMAPPAPQPIFQGEAPPIAQQQEQGGGHEFTRMLLEKRNRGMLG
jgi:predicted alpha/beta superfamily hydrolase